MRLIGAPAFPSLVLFLSFFLAGVPRATAQDPGVRAAGMGGAFTAVADDGSAVFWNPAGLGTGAFFSLVLDRNTAEDGSATLIALGTPPLGLSYYRTATGDRANGRNSLVAHHAGVTVVQSLGDRGLTVGATLKAVRGVVGSGSGSSVSSTKFDADFGVMASGSLGRLGLTVHNLFEPEFTGPVTPVSLDRRVRAGISLNTSKLTTMSADVDLVGKVKQAAVGGELHAITKAWLRGGVHWNTSGADTAPIGSVGGTVAVYGSTVADVQVSFGSEQGNRGWGAGLRFVF